MAAATLAATTQATFAPASAAPAAAPRWWVTVDVGRGSAGSLRRPRARPFELRVRMLSSRAVIEPALARLSVAATGIVFDPELNGVCPRSTLLSGVSGATIGCARQALGFVDATGLVGPPGTPRTAPQITRCSLTGTVFGGRRAFALQIYTGPLYDRECVRSGVVVTNATVRRARLDGLRTDELRLAFPTEPDELLRHPLPDYALNFDRLVLSLPRLVVRSKGRSRYLAASVGCGAKRRRTVRVVLVDETGRRFTVKRGIRC